jgi:hypothetical protein
MKTNSRNHPQKTQLELRDNRVEAPHPPFFILSATPKPHLQLRFLSSEFSQKNTSVD